MGRRFEGGGGEEATSWIGDSERRRGVLVWRIEKWV